MRKAWWALLPLAAALASLAGSAQADPSPLPTAVAPVVATVTTATAPVQGAVAGASDALGGTSNGTVAAATTTTAATAATVSTAADAAVGQTAPAAAPLLTSATQTVSSTADQTAATVKQTTGAVAAATQDPTATVTQAVSGTGATVNGTVKDAGNAGQTVSSLSGGSGTQTATKNGTPSGPTGAGTDPSSSAGPTTAPTASPATSAPPAAGTAHGASKGATSKGSKASVPQPTATTAPATGVPTPGHTLVDPAPKAQSGVTATFERIVKVVPRWLWLAFLALALIALLATIRSYVEGRRRGRLVVERSALSADLAVLQSTLLPELPKELGPLSTSAAYAPAEGLASGGDFYDAFVTGDGQLAFLLGDVSGHGREAIARAALARYTTRAFLAAGASLSEAFHAADQALAAEGDVDSFVTCIACLFDPESRLLTYAQAGHHAPLFSARADTENASGVPLGTALADEWPQSTTRLLPGERLCLFSDGTLEARVGDELFGRERLRELFLAGGDSEELLGAVSAATTVVDDVTVLILELEPEVKESPAPLHGAAALQI